MLNHKPQRGRPKGSGIDDRAVLLAVAERMQADPQLKPTTAIKAAGISDPSVIRRLRDKFRHLEAELRLELAASKPNVSAATVAKPQPAMACAIQSKSEAVSQRFEPRAAGQTPATPAPSNARQSRAGATTADGMLVAWMSFGLTAFNAALQAQQIAAEQLLKLPHFSAVMRQHLAFSEMAMSFCAPKSTGRLTLH